MMKSGKLKIVTWDEHACGGNRYQITVRMYNEELNHVTADWDCGIPELSGGLGYGGSCASQAISDAKLAIETAWKARANAN